MKRRDSRETSAPAPTALQVTLTMRAQILDYNKHTPRCALPAADTRRTRLGATIHVKHIRQIRGQLQPPRKTHTDSEIVPKDSVQKQASVADDEAKPS